MIFNTQMFDVIKYDGNPKLEGFPHRKPFVINVILQFVIYLFFNFIEQLKFRIINGE